MTRLPAATSTAAVKPACRLAVGDRIACDAGILEVTRLGGTSKVIVTATVIYSPTGTGLTPGTIRTAVFDKGHRFRVAD